MTLRLTTLRPLDLGMIGLALAAATLILGLPLFFAASFIIGSIILVATLIDPAVGLGLTVATVMVQEIIVFPMGLTTTHVVGAMALGTWLLAGLAQREIVIHTRLVVPWTLFLGALLLTAALTPYNAVDSLKQVVRWILAFLAFIVTVSTITTPRRMIGLIVVILIVGVLESLVGVRQYLTGTGPFAIGETVRAFGTIGKPNTFAGFLEMCWPLGMAITLGCLWQWWLNRIELRWLVGAALAGGATLIILAGFAFSFSRGGWLGGAVAVLVMIALAGGRRAVPMLIGLVLVGLFVVAQPQLFPPIITERITSITDNLKIFDAGTITVTDDNFAVVERMAHWQAGFNMFMAHPILGVGPDNFNKAYPSFFVGRWSISQGHAHNYYIHIAAESGVIGLITYVILIGSVIRLGWQAVQITRGTAWNMVAIGGCGIIAAIQVHSMFDNLHVLNFGIHLSAVWGILAVLVLRRGWRT